LAIAVGVLLVFTAAWLLRVMGGGDVKLLAALALWFAPLPLADMLVVMALSGGVLTLVTLILHKRARRSDPVEVPYGVAIAFAAAWALTNQILTIPAG
ncbi:MAG: peptidase, partial [Hyphomicrobiales bacterium]